MEQQVPQALEQPQNIATHRHVGCNFTLERLLSRNNPITNMNYDELDWCPLCILFEHRCKVGSHPSVPAGKSIK